MNAEDFGSGVVRGYNSDDIKQYIDDKYGFKVYIAYFGQVKAKPAVGEHENHKDRHHPGKPTACPMEKAIMGAETF